MNLKNLLLQIIMVLPFALSGQKNSLWAMWNDKNAQDSNRLKALDKIIWEHYLFSMPDSAYYWSKEEYKFATEKKLKKFQGWALNNQGVAMRLQGNYRKAIDYTIENIKLQEELGNKPGLASALNNLGLIYFYLENFPKALEFYEKSLAINQEINRKSDIALNIGNIALLYSTIGELEKAIKLNLQSLKIREELNDKQGMAIAYNNLGNIYQDINEFDNALYYYEKASIIYEEINDQQGLANVLNNIGTVYKEMGSIDKAFKYSERSLQLAQKTGSVLETKNASNTLYLLHRSKGNNAKALAMHELYVSIKDSILKKESQNDILNQEYRLKFTLDSARIEDEKKLISAQLDVQKAEIKQAQTQRYALTGGILVLLVFGGFVYNRFRVSQKQKSIIEAKKAEVEIQKEIIEKRQKEVTDSINYAKRLQDAILPDMKLIQNKFKESFIIYQPKDVVSGDFYWIEKKGNQIFLAVADCTGHGVPGALVSVVCYNMLNRAVNEFRLKEPALILDKTRELVIETFATKDIAVSDGMDIALCVIDLDKMKLKYAGANNSFWLVRKSENNELENRNLKLNNFELIEFKADKQPIGVYIIMQNFSQTLIDIQPGDSIYLSSDGFADQFGGEKGKKFMSKQLKRLILTFQENTMTEQEKQIQKTFFDWKGNLEQVDDVCIVGIKL